MTISKTTFLRRALELAVVTEELGGQYYRDLAKKFADDKDVAEVFFRLAEDEALHETQCRALVGQLEARTGGEHEEGDAYYLLRAAALSEFFERGTWQKTDDIKTSADALAKALNFERSTLLFYISLNELLGPSPELDDLIAAEKGHVTALAKVLITNSRFRGLADPW